MNRSRMLQRVLVSQAFAPSDIDDLELWFDASSLNYNDGDLVDVWNDKSANSNNATSSGTLRPTFKTNILNGKPIVRFSATVNNTMTFTELNTVDSFTYFVLWSKATTGNSQILGYADNAYQYLQYGDRWFIGNQRDRAVPMPLDTFEVRAGQLNPTTGKRWVNGVENLSSGGIAGGENSYKFKDIGITDFIGPMGDIAEIIVYNRMLPQPEIEEVSGYLIEKWGITL